MEISKRIEAFEDELKMIKNEKLRKFVEDCLKAASDYFFHVAASSTGKYHPSYTLGDGGLVRHTKAAVKIANDLLNLEQSTSMREELGDEIIAALILHDSVKHGNNGSKYTVTEHPLLAADFIENQLTIHISNYSAEDREILEASVQAVGELIRSHMGQWNYDYRNPNKEVLPKPLTEGEQFVHMCDYLASRKYLTVEGV